MARELSGGETEVSVLLPDRKYKGVWHRLLHDRTADAIQEQVSKLAHANVTTIPFHFGTRQVAVSGTPDFEVGTLPVEPRCRTVRR